MKKNFTPFTTRHDNWQLTAFPAGKNTVELVSGSRCLMRITRGAFAGFAELSALPEIFRLHRSEDGFSAELESRSVIPFGSEFKVERNIVITHGAASMVTSVAACNRGEVGNITLEPLEFPGPWAKVNYLLFGDDKLHSCKFRENAEIYNGSEIPWYIQVEYHDGSKIEFMTGSDLWRHRSASRMEGVTASFRLADTDGTLVFERQLLIYGEETPIEKRPWQFETLFAWSAPCQKTAEGTPVAIPGCLASRPVQRALRHAVRSAQSNLVLTDYKAAICTDAAHLDRPGKKVLEHLDLQDLFQFYCWGNRQLAKKGLALTVAQEEQSLLPGSLLLERLGQLPEQLDFETEE